jgi:hypothetical protein
MIIPLLVGRRHRCCTLAATDVKVFSLLLQPLPLSATSFAGRNCQRTCTVSIPQGSCAQIRYPHEVVDITARRGYALGYLRTAQPPRWQVQQVKNIRLSLLVRIALPYKTTNRGLSAEVLRYSDSIEYGAKATAENITRNQPGCRCQLS